MGNAELARNPENAGISHIRNDNPDVCRQVTGADLLEDRSTICSLARAEDAQRKAAHFESQASFSSISEVE